MLDQPAAQLPVTQRTDPERSFAEEVRALRLGDGEIFRDVLVESQDLLDELGVHLETCTKKSSAAALPGAAINYPLRGCATWKSIVGTNVAADALSNLASPGVIGGALIAVGEDYGAGASIIQERARPGRA
jgi:indolepyruvate ferredoxin oxidoreductase alpha subunit